MINYIKMILKVYLLKNDIIKGHKDFKKHKISNRSQLFKVCQELEENSKIFISENKEISLI